MSISFTEVSSTEWEEKECIAVVKGGLEKAYLYVLLAGLTKKNEENLKETILELKNE